MKQSQWAAVLYRREDIAGGLLVVGSTHGVWLRMADAPCRPIKTSCTYVTTVYALCGHTYFQVLLILGSDQRTCDITRGKHGLEQWADNLAFR